MATTNDVKEFLRGIFDNDKTMFEMYKRMLYAGGITRGGGGYHFSRAFKRKPTKEITVIADDFSELIQRVEDIKFVRGMYMEICSYNKVIVVTEDFDGKLFLATTVVTV